MDSNGNDWENRVRYLREKDLDDWKTKVIYFEKKLRNEPDNGLLWLEYGDFLNEECDSPEKTIFAYQKAAELLPDKDLRLSLGEAYSKAEDIKKGVRIIKQSLKENPRSYGYCILAGVYLSNKMYHDAAAACRRSLELDRDYEEAYYLLGEATREEDRELSVIYYRKAISYDGEYQVAWHALGRELIAEEDTIEEGISALRKAIELDPEDGWAKIFLANALWRTGKNREADKQYKAAISAFPDYPEFRKFYKDFQSSQEETDNNDP